MASNAFELLDEIRSIVAHAVKFRQVDDAIVVKQIHEKIETYEMERLHEQSILSDTSKRL